MYRYIVEINKKNLLLEMEEKCLFLEILNNKLKLDSRITEELYQLQIFDKDIETYYDISLNDLPDKGKVKLSLKEPVYEFVEFVDALPMSPGKATNAKIVNDNPSQLVLSNISIDNDCSSSYSKVTDSPADSPVSSLTLNEKCTDKSEISETWTSSGILKWPHPFRICIEKLPSSLRTVLELKQNLNSIQIRSLSNVLYEQISAYTL